MRLKMMDIPFLSLAPWWLRCHIRIRAAIDDGCDSFAEPRPDYLQCRPTSLILYSNMEQSRDRFILIATMGEDET